MVEVRLDGILEITCETVCGIWASNQVWLSKDRSQDMEEGALGMALASEEDGTDPSVVSQQPLIICAGYQPGGNHCMTWHK